MNKTTGFFCGRCGYDLDHTKRIPFQCSCWVRTLPPSTRDIKIQKGQYRHDNAS